MLCGICGRPAEDREGLSRGAALDSHVTAEYFGPGLLQEHDPDLTLLAAFTHCPISGGLIIWEIVVHYYYLSFTVHKHT
jgi:hypothetical protein